jgi:hypothetical protein
LVISRARFSPPAPRFSKRQTATLIRGATSLEILIRVWAETEEEQVKTQARAREKILGFMDLLGQRFNGSTVRRFSGSRFNGSEVHGCLCSF